MASLFVEKRTGRKSGEFPYVSTKDVNTAKELLKHVPMPAMGNFFDYAFSEAEKTHFDVQTLGGVKQYVNGYRQYAHYCTLN